MVWLFQFRQKTRKNPYLKLEVLNSSKALIGYFFMMLVMFFSSTSSLVTSYMNNIIRVDSVHALFKRKIDRTPGIPEEHQDKRDGNQQEQDNEVIHILPLVVIGQLCRDLQHNGYTNTPECPYPPLGPPLAGDRYGFYRHAADHPDQRSPIWFTCAQIKLRITCNKRSISRIVLVVTTGRTFGISG